MAKDILVVDDEPDIIEHLHIALEDNGYSVRSAPNGIEAWNLIKESKPDLILLDLMMPEETGTGLYRRLHDRKEFRDIPVVIISGLAGRNVAVSRSVVVLDKPLDETRVLDEVRKAIGA